jgi:hypothetical protein
MALGEGTQGPGVVNAAGFPARRTSISSSVARNAAMSCVGSFCTKPTVSEMSTSVPLGITLLRVVGSSVANRTSAACTSAAVSALMRLTSIGVAYKGNHRHACRLPAPPVCLPVLTDELDLLAQCCHLVPAHITHTHVRPSHGDMLSLLVKLAPAVGFLKVHLMLATLAAVEHMS